MFLSFCVIFHEILFFKFWIWTSQHLLCCLKNDTVNTNHMQSSSCMLHVWCMHTNDSSVFFPLPDFLLTHSLSVTFTCAPCSLSCLIIVRRWVESLFLVGAPDRGGACSGSSPWNERGRVGTKRWTYSWGQVSVLPSAGWDEVSPGVICTLAQPGFARAWKWSLAILSF